MPRCRLRIDLERTVKLKVWWLLFGWWIFACLWGAAYRLSPTCASSRVSGICRKSCFLRFRKVVGRFVSHCVLMLPYMQPILSWLIDCWMHRKNHFYSSKWPYEHALYTQRRSTLRRSSKKWQRQSHQYHNNQGYPTTRLWVISSCKKESKWQASRTADEVEG